MVRVILENGAGHFEKWCGSFLKMVRVIFENRLMILKNRLIILENDAGHFRRSSDNRFLISEFQSEILGLTEMPPPL
jgi:hypothetical protein